MTYKCTNCGAENRSPFQMINSQNITFSGNSSQCRRCGAMSNPIADGVYDFDEQGRATLLKDLSGLNLTTGQLYALGDAVSKARSTGGTASSMESFSSEVATISPSLLAILERYLKYIVTPEGAFNFLMTLIAIIPLLENKEPQSVINNYYETNITNYEINVSDDNSPKSIEKRQKEPTANGRVSKELTMTKNELEAWQARVDKRRFLDSLRKVSR